MTSIIANDNQVRYTTSDKLFEFSLSEDSKLTCRVINLFGYTLIKEIGQESIKWNDSFVPHQWKQLKNDQLIQKLLQSGYFPVYENNHVEFKYPVEQISNNQAPFQELLAKAQQGIGYAQNNLGVCYRDGFHVPRSYDEARKWFEKGAQNKNPMALTNLGALYEEGLGVPYDTLIAENLYQKAAKFNHVPAYLRLGLLYVQQGQSYLQKDYKAKPVADSSVTSNYSNFATELNPKLLSQEKMTQALKWLSLAAKAEDAEAQFQIGWLYDKGLLPNEDLTKVIPFYKKAAEKGHPGALYRLAELTEQGLGVDPSEVNAMLYYAKSAALNNESARYKLGIFFEKFNQREKALEQISKAAESGHTKAQFKLGQMLEKSTEKPWTQARYWYSKAAESGDLDAKKALEEIEKILAATESPQDVVQSRLFRAVTQAQPVAIPKSTDQMIYFLEKTPADQKTQNEIAEFLQVLKEERAIKQQKLETIQKFRRDPNLSDFYNSIMIKVEELLISVKAAAGGFTQISEGQLSNSSAGISFLGSVLSLAPIVGSLTSNILGVASAALDKADEIMQENLAKNISRLGSLAQLQKGIEKAARELTLIFEPQLKQLPVYNQSGKLSPAQQAGELVALWVCEALIKTPIGDDPTKFDLKILQIVYDQKPQLPSTKIENMISTAMKAFQDFKSMATGEQVLKPVMTRQGQVWKIDELFTHCGLCDEKGRQSTPQGARPDIYGYCFAPKEMISSRLS